MESLHWRDCFRGILSPSVHTAMPLAHFAILQHTAFCLRMNFNWMPAVLCSSPISFIHHRHSWQLPRSFQCRIPATPPPVTSTTCTPSPRARRSAVREATSAGLAMVTPPDVYGSVRRTKKLLLDKGWVCRAGDNRIFPYVDTFGQQDSRCAEMILCIHSFF